MKKIYVLLSFLFLLSFTLIGCGDSVGENQLKDDSNSNYESDDSVYYSDKINNRAKKEGVSESDMQNMIDELTIMTAEKYGDTVENYKKSLADEGKTPFDEFATAADYMGITIKEYYEYEKNRPELSEEEKAMLESMKNATSDIDLSELEKQAKELEEAAKQMEENANDNSNSTDSQNKVITNNITDIGKYNVLEILNEENDSELNHYYVEYTTEKNVADVTTYYKDLLEGSEEYFIMDGSPSASVIMGTINGISTEVSIERDFENNITYVTFGYQEFVEE